ncbi:MAG TPA: hypothetical protein DIW52_02160 [Pseudomonas sp.]|nr:hypothetical protein [Pseudomonas sp.]
MAIVEGGAPVAGVPAQPALSAIPLAAEVMVINTIPSEALLKQNIVFREASTGICPVCEAGQERQSTEEAQA